MEGPAIFEGFEEWAYLTKPCNDALARA